MTILTDEQIDILKRLDALGEDARQFHLSSVPIQLSELRILLTLLPPALDDARPV